MTRSAHRTSCIVAIGLAVAPLASAQTQTVSHSVPYASQVLTQTWTSTLTVPRFDPSLGHLTTVVLNLDGFLHGASRQENVSAAPISAQAETTAALTLNSLPPIPPVAVFPVIVDGQADLPAFDGTLDYAGTSGFDRPFAPVFGGPGSDYRQRVLFSATDLAPFLGPAGAPGTIAFGVQASQSVDNQTGPTLAVDSLATISGTFRLDYLYEILPGAICTSAASWGGCPCSNAGSPGNGCGNSLHPSGAGLARTGVASLANDTLALTATNVTGANAIFVQSNALLDPGIFFGDGLRCVSGATIRLGSSPIAAASSSYPQGAQLPISVRGGVAAPGLRYYQTYYRNSASYCTAATFNLSSGQAVLWQL